VERGREVWTTKRGEGECGEGRGKKTTPTLEKIQLQTQERVQRESVRRGT